MAESLVALGEIVTTHGLDGWVKFNPFNRDTNSLSPGAQVVLESPGGQTSFAIEASKPHRRQFLIKLHGVNSIEQAERWVGSTLYVNEHSLDALEPGQYYCYQVIGFEVVQMNGESVGNIISIMSTPGGEIYVVQGKTKEHLIPAVREIVEHIDFTAGKVSINPPAGLLDL